MAGHPDRRLGERVERVVRARQAWAAAEYGGPSKGRALSPASIVGAGLLIAIVAVVATGAGITLDSAGLMGDKAPIGDVAAAAGGPGANTAGEAAAAGGGARGAQGASPAASSGAAGAAVDPASLATPLHIPALAADGSCPRSTGRTLVPAIGSTLGPGPVNPAGMTAGGILQTTTTRAPFLATVTWIAAPSYQGAAFVRGRQVGRDGIVKFGGATATSAVSAQLRLPSGGGTLVAGAQGWRTWRTAMAVPVLGCYALQVDGNGFSTVIVFQAN
jgi:hypothetical protein